MQEEGNKRYPFDLEERTSRFAENIISLSRSLPINIENDIIRRQFVRSGTSVGANYREANESISKKDFVHRLRICRKESKETHYWLGLLVIDNEKLMTTINAMARESMEFVKIFSKIIENNESMK